MSSRRIFMLLSVVIGVLLTASSLLASDDPVWPTYHYSSGRQGQNSGSTDITGNSLGLTWVWPKLAMTKKSDIQMTVDNNDATYFSSTGTWTSSGTAISSGEAYETDFIYSDSPSTATATWTFPDSILTPSTPANGIHYKVYVWIPAEYTDIATGVSSTITNTSLAQYTVKSGLESFTYTIDQSDTDAAGSWRLLTNRAFTFAAGDYVKLSDGTSDDTDTIIVADAIKFVPVTGVEIYSSPVSAELDCTTYTANDRLAAAYIGTIESPVGTSIDAPDTGSVYCINAVAAATAADAHAADVGTPIWEYPSKTAASRASDEGPIEGGFFSSPTLAYVADSSQPGNPQILALIMAGMDKQIYVFDAAGVGTGKDRTPRILWQGPGFVVGESAAWTDTSTNRLDAFGGSFTSTPCAATASSTTSWTFPIADRQAKGEPSGVGEGWSYAVYAWMPAKLSTDPNRIPDAVYTIHYTKVAADNSINTNATATVTINQANIDNQGKWVKLGSYFNVSEVGLSNISKDTASIVGGSIVVADTIKIVPEQFEAFGYSSPIIDNNNLKDNSTNAGSIYATTSNGRIISFNALPTGTFGKVNWVYPNIRTKLVVTGSDADGAEKPDLGDVTASPAYYNGKLYQSTMDGKIYCIDAITHDDGWTPTTYFDAYPGSDEPYGFSSSPVIDPVLNCLYAASTNGDVFSVNLLDGSQAWKAPLTSDDAIGAVRFSTPVLAVDKDNVRRIWVASTDGFVHSYLASDGTKLTDVTATVYDDPGRGFPIQGSVAMDGTSAEPLMYFGDMNGVLRWYKASNGEPVNVTYNGWRTDGQLFSSPAISDVTFGAGKASYVFVGGSDGRLYAFSEGIFGGGWAQGDAYWQFEGTSAGEAQKEAAYDPSTAEAQIDIFNKTFFNNSDVAGKAEPHDITVPTALIAPDTTFSPASSTDYWIVDKAMKLVNGTVYDTNADTFVDDTAALSTFLTTQAKSRRDSTNIHEHASRLTGDTIYFEWGESIYVIIWNLPGKAQLFGGNDSTKRTNLKLSLTNTTADSSAGSIVTAKVKTLEEYTILDSSKPVAGVTDGYEPLKGDGGATEFKRSYALAQIDIKGTGSRPPSPGSGWNLSLEVKKQDSTGALTSQEIIPLAKLVGTDPDPKKAQKLGINNPLAIQVLGGTGIAWSATGKPVSTDPEAHVNGNPSGKMPVLELGAERFITDSPVVGHGSTSPQQVLQVQDRSAMGMDRDLNSSQKQELTRFRINSNDLLWRGGEAAIATVDYNGLTYGRKFSWEFGIGSIDYPNISKKDELFRNYYDDKNPATESSKLAGVLPNVGAPTDYLLSSLQPTSVFISVSVPKYQPANMQGYRRTMEAYIDSDGNGSWNSGNAVLGRPSTYQEVYRRFRVSVKVPPDPKIEIDEQTIDIGNPAHGLGEPNANLGTNWEFFPINTSNPYDDVAVSRPHTLSWFKPMTIKNAGNVNLYNLHIDKENLNSTLYADPNNPSVPIDAHQIISSLDNTLDVRLGGTDPNIQLAEPFSSGSIGYTLTKPRVGDADPTVLQIPDKRKVETLALSAPFDTSINQYTPKVSVRIPLSQQVGTYYAPEVLVYSDLDSNGVFDDGEPISNPGFQLKVTVKESQVTGEPVDEDQANASLYQVDAPLPPDNQFQIDNPFPRTGNATPAAFMDANTGNVYLYWPSNRMNDTLLYPDWKNLITDPGDPGYADSQKMMADFAGAPWFINKARLIASGTTWDPFSSSQWWETSTIRLPGTPASPNYQWPSSLLGTDPGAYVPFWQFNGAATTLKSVQHFAPTIGENPDVDKAAPSGKTWIAWIGRAEKVLTKGTVEYENRIFYADATHNSITNVYTIDHDPSSAKRSPSIALYGDRMWTFWQAGGGNQWSIAYSVNSDSAHLPKDGSNNDLWTSDARVRLPDAMSGASSPNALARVIWEKLTGSSSGYTSNPQRIFDLIYAGSNKINQNSDICLTRYAAVAPSDPHANTAAPNRRAQPLPRIYGEKLEKSAKYGFYTSKHIAWVRLDKSRLEVGVQTPVVDNRGGYVYTDAYPDLPYVYVKLGAGYNIANGYANDYPSGTIVSATDGSITLPNGTVVVPATPITPLIDEATGVYTYTYPNADTKAILGQTLVDYSAGVVRFTMPLKEAFDTGESKFVRTAVYADYTPQTWRLTTDNAVDNSPKAFIERTNMTYSTNPGMGTWEDGSGNLYSAPVDRLWVFWRKAAAGAASSTIFYKTYRMGVDFTKVPGANPVLVKNDGTPALDATHPFAITNNLGPYEIDRTGTKIYFTGVDERYQSLDKIGSTDVFGTSPGNLGITYNYGYDSSTGALLSKTLTITDISWIEELPEQSLLGNVTEGNVNEGSITAFADPIPVDPAKPWSKIWVFWTSTRSGSSNLFWETLTPNLIAK